MKKLILSTILTSILFGAVDINSANKHELATLHGISETKAEAIIAYRKTNCFKNTEEIMKVKGVGNKTYEKNKSNIKVGECKK